MCRQMCRDTQDNFTADGFHKRHWGQVIQLGIGCCRPIKKKKKNSFPLDSVGQEAFYFISLAFWILELCMFNIQHKCCKIPLIGKDRTGCTALKSWQWVIKTLTLNILLKDSVTVCSPKKRVRGCQLKPTFRTSHSGTWAYKGIC